MDVRMISVGYLTLDRITASGVTRDTMGGAALYAALGATLSTRGVGMVSRVGDDFPVSNLERLQRLGIDCAGINVSDGLSSQFSVRYDSNWNEHYDRVVLGVGADITLADLPASFRSAQSILVNSMLPALQEPFARWARHQGLRVVLTTNYIYLSDFEHREILFRSLANVDIFICNRREAEAIAGNVDFPELLHNLARLCPCPIITNADSIWFIHDGQAEMMSVARADVIDPTGAGDTFAGVVSAAAAVGQSLPEAISAASIIATMTVQGFGPSALLERLERR